MSRRDVALNQEAVKLEIQILEIELLDMKGQHREKAMESYRRLLRLRDKPVYLTRSDE